MNMKIYIVPATEIVAVKTKSCQMISTQSGQQDPGAPQFAPARGENIIG